MRTYVQNSKRTSRNALAHKQCEREIKQAKRTKFNFKYNYYTLLKCLGKQGNKELLRELQRLRLCKASADYAIEVDRFYFNFMIVDEIWFNMTFEQKRTIQILNKKLRTFLKKGLRQYGLYKFDSGIELFYMKDQFPNIYQCLKKSNRYKSKQIEFAQFIKYVPQFIIENLGKKMYLVNHGGLVFHLYNGNNIRTYKGLEFDMTRKMAHLFHTQYFDCSINAVFQYCFVLSLGGTQEIAQYMGNYWSCLTRQNQDLLKSIVLFFNKYNDLSRDTICKILGYLKHCDDEQISISFKGRTLKSLMRIVDAYYQEMRRMRDLLRQKERQEYQALTWKGADYQEWNYCSNKGEWYAIFQLKKAIHLDEESVRMYHCVRTYTRKCLEGNCSIWSLRIKEDGDWKSLVTIEVSNTHRIVQAKSRFNALPSPIHSKMIQRWAKQVGIQN